MHGLAWMIKPDLLPLAMEIEGKTFLQEIVEQESNLEIGEIQGSIGIVHIKGILVPCLDLEKIFGGEFLPLFRIQDQIEEYLNDSSIDRIILSFDSPGGAVDGIFNLAEYISKSSQIKPIIAYINESAFSAAYWLASACNKVYLSSPTAQVGSIGVILIHQNIEKRLEAIGIKVTEIFSGKYKNYGSPYDSLSDDEKKYIQSIIDDLYEIFTSKIAEYRNKSLDYVLSDMAEGKTFVGKSAITAGLADEIIEKTIFLEKNSMGLFGKKTQTRAEEPEKKDEPIPAEEPEKKDDSEAEEPEKKDDSEAEEPEKKDDSEAEEPGKKDKLCAILAKERKRISAISEIAAVGMESLAQKAVNDGWSVEAFAFQQTKELKNRGISLQQIISGANQDLSFQKSPETKQESIISAIDKGLSSGMAKQGRPGINQAQWK